MPTFVFQVDLEFFAFPSVKSQGAESQLINDLSGVTLLAYNHNYTLALGSQAEADGSFVAGRLRPGTWHLYFYAAAEGYLDRAGEGAFDMLLSEEPAGVEVPGGGVKPTCSKMARTCASVI